jgi:hypothetical protein
MIKYSSSSDDELTVASKLYLISSSGRRYSAHPINAKRQNFGEFHHLYQEVKTDPQKFHDHVRMSMETFQYLLIGIKGNMKLCVSGHGLEPTNHRRALKKHSDQESNQFDS